MNPKRIRLLLVDDSAAFRGLLAEALAAHPDLEIAGSVPNGQLAIQHLASTPVDVVILDLEMPVMDGLTALPGILKARPGVAVIVCSAATQDGARATLDALVAGALDHVCKPSAVNSAARVDLVTRELVERIRALAGGPARQASPRTHPAPPTFAPIAASSVRPEVLLIGSSTGGPSALEIMLPALGPSFTLPILLVQHMPVVFTRLFAERLGKVTGRPCREAEHGEPVRAGHIHVAPGGFHMTVALKGGVPHLALDRAEPEHHCRPAVDPLFRTAAAVFGGAALAVVLTGMGVDGRAGAAALVSAGARVLVQDEASCVVWGMPGAVATAGLASAALPPDRLARACVQAVEDGR